MRKEMIINMADNASNIVKIPVDIPQSFEGARLHFEYSDLRYAGGVVAVYDENNRLRFEKILDVCEERFDIEGKVGAGCWTIVYGYLGNEKAIGPYANIRITLDAA